MARSEIKYIQKCVKAVCEASPDILRLCNVIDVEKARKNLATISAPVFTSLEPPLSLESVVESRFSALQTPDYPVPEERRSSLPTSTYSHPEPQEGDRVRSPESSGNVAPKPSAATTVSSETLFRNVLNQRESVELLVQRTVEASLGFHERNPGVDYERLTNGLDEDKYSGHHSIIWFYDEYTRSGLSMAEYVTSLKLPKRASKRRLQILGDGRKLRTIDDGFKKRFEERLKTRNALPGNRLEVEPSHNAGVEGALLPWLSLHHKLWSRMASKHIPKFLDLCISHQEIFDCAPVYSAFYNRCKDHYQSKFPHGKNKIRCATHQGIKRKHSSALNTQQQRSTHRRVEAHGILRRGTETSVAQHASGSPSQNLGTGDGEDSSEVLAAQSLDQTTAHRHASGRQGCPSRRISIIDTSRTQSQIQVTAIRTDRFNNGNMAVFDSAVADDFNTVSDDLDTVPDGFNDGNMAAFDNAVADDFNTMPDGFNDGNMAAFDNAVADDFNTMPDGFNDGNMAAFDSAVADDFNTMPDGFNDGNMAAFDNAVADDFNTMPDGFNDGNMAAFDSAVADDFNTMPDGFNDGNMAAFDSAVADDFNTMPDGFNDGNMAVFDNAVADGFNTMPDDFNTMPDGFNDGNMATFDNAVADDFNTMPNGFNDGNMAACDTPGTVNIL